MDYLILNRDRHGANIEVLRNSKKKTMRLAPLFDHGLYFLFRCETPEQIAAFDVMADTKVQSYVASQSARENLNLIPHDRFPALHPLKETDRGTLMEGLDDAIPVLLQDRIWEMIWRRWQVYQADLFTTVRVQVGGYGITWGEDLDIADTALYQAGQPVPLCQEDFAAYIANNLITTAEAAELLGCSRQNVNDLVSRGVLQPVKTSAKSKLFLKSDVLLRKVQH